MSEPSILTKQNCV